ncbi:MAG: adenosylcobinamide-phosphate synthase CbiB [Microcoleaceae cyanobacterium]
MFFISEVATLASWVTQFYPILMIVIAAFLDYKIGDPKKWLHPVQLMGKVIEVYTQIVLTHIKNPLSQKIAGILLTIGLIFCSGFAGGLLIKIVKVQLAPYNLDQIGQIILESILLASCFAGRSLRDAAVEVLHPLQQGDIIQARQQLSYYVGRDTENLSTAEILRAILETVTENATDGVMAPLFYALIGIIFIPLGSIPLALAYKAASTLDSMIAYQEYPYTHLGWFSAKLEDILTWLPCRLTVITIALLSGKPLFVWQICQRDAIYDPSPNAGWSECAYAATLGVQLGGENQYRGITKYKPILGDSINEITPETINHALRLTRWSFLIWIGLFMIGYSSIHAIS